MDPSQAGERAAAIPPLSAAEKPSAPPPSPAPRGSPSLAGEALYVIHGYTVRTRYGVPLRGGLALLVVSMSKSLMERPNGGSTLLVIEHLEAE